MKFNNGSDFKIISTKEILTALLFFAFMIIHPAYLGLGKKGLNLLFITLLTLPTLFLYFYAFMNPKTKRETFNLLIVIAFFILFIGIKIYRGMDSIGKEGDRDDQLYQSINYFLKGIYPFDKPTFLNQPITCGLASIVLSLPFVKFFNNINIFTIFVMVFIVFYLWKYVEKTTARPILTLALTTMVFFPYFNWSYWESSEEILYGWPFLYLAVLIFIKDWINTKWLKFFCIGILLGICGMVRINYAFPIIAVLFFIFKTHLRYSLYSLAGIILAVSVFSMPFFILNYRHFFSHYLWGSIMYARGNYEITFFVIIVFFELYLNIIRKLPLVNQVHILIALSTIVGYIYSGLLLVPWHVFNWMIPSLIALPFIKKPNVPGIALV